uniref:Uncharacterized protein n=1 Tax=Gasterosteus aculeatus TaxID=69293 RepID=G3NH02_GASAC
LILHIHFSQKFLQLFFGHFFFPPDGLEALDLGSWNGCHLLPTVVLVLLYRHCTLTRRFGSLFFFFFFYTQFFLYEMISKMFQIEKYLA